MQIILSIQPQFVEKIFAGEKTFEFRKSVPAAVRSVIVYASRPVQRVVGAFAVKRVLQSSPDGLWNMTKHGAGVGKSFYDAYFAGKQTAYAIEIGAVKRFTEPRALSAYNIKIPPQSYCIYRMPHDAPNGCTQ